MKVDNLAASGATEGSSALAREASPESHRLGLTAVVFPGDRRVWRWSLLAAIPIVVLLGYSLLRPRPYYTGTNSVGVRSIVANITAHQRVCVPGLELPGGTGAVQISYAVLNDSPPPVSVVLLAGGRAVAQGSVTGSPPPPPAHVTVPLTPRLPARPAFRAASMCVTTGRGGTVALAGFAGSPTNAQPMRLDGHPIAGNIGVWFSPPSGTRASLAAQWPAIMRRVALFRPSFAGPAFYWVLFLVGLPLLIYFSLRLFALSTAPGRRLGLGLTIVAFASAGMWAVTTAAFDTPDESEHFAYVESLAETGRAPSSVFNQGRPYATDEVFALDAIRHFSTISFGDARPPWLAVQQSAWRTRMISQHPSRADGGGYNAVTWVHSPLYYATAVPVYAAARGAGVFSELFWMRLESALMGALVALLVFATIRELAPSRPELAVGGGLLVAFQPMVSFMAGAVDNDSGVNLAAALVVYLIVRMLRRGLSPRLGVALGLASAALPLMKGTGFALYPAVGLAVLAALVRDHTRAQLRGLAAAAGGFLAVAIAWALVAGSFHRNLLPVPTGTGVAGGQLGGKLTYLWEVFFPRLPFMARHFASGEWPFSFIYIHRGFAAFGWYAIYFPKWVYFVILGALVAAAVLGLTTVAQMRAAVRERWREVTFLVLVVASVVAGVELAYYASSPRPEYLTPEQGRYAFTAIVPIAALLIGGLVRLPRRASQAIVTIALIAMIGLNVASHLLYLSQTFT